MPWQTSPIATFRPVRRFKTHAVQTTETDIRIEVRAQKIPRRKKHSSHEQGCEETADGNASKVREIRAKIGVFRVLASKVLTCTVVHGSRQIAQKRNLKGLALEIAANIFGTYEGRAIVSHGFVIVHVVDKFR